MNINLGDDYLGNFTSYKKQDIVKLLLESFHIRTNRLFLYNNAMDNTVIDVNDQYILKIYETKSVDFITNALENYEKFHDFYSLKLIKNINYESISYIYSKPCLVYKKIYGTVSYDLSMLSPYVSKFHKHSFLSYKELDVNLLISKLSEKINFYLNNNVKEELCAQNRLTTYELLIEKLFSIPNKQKILLPYGFIHGDCSPSNVIKNNLGFHFLDLDSLHEDFQFWDFIDLLLKYTNQPNIAEEVKIINLYMQDTGFYKKVELSSFYELINLLACYKGIVMALSTEYYCFEKRKFTLDVMNSFFLKQILQLISNVELRLENLKW